MCGALDDLDVPVLPVLDCSADGAEVGGSPTILIDGEDLFPGSAQLSAHCRLYQDGADLTGVPGRGELRQALVAKLGL